MTTLALLLFAPSQLNLKVGDHWPAAEQRTFRQEGDLVFSERYDIGFNVLAIKEGQIDVEVTHRLTETVTPGVRLGPPPGSKPEKWTETWDIHGGTVKANFHPSYADTFRVFRLGRPVLGGGALASFVEGLPTATWTMGTDEWSFAEKDGIKGKFKVELDPKTGVPVSVKGTVLAMPIPGGEEAADLTYEFKSIPPKR
jgi:hypothetical protein